MKKVEKVASGANFAAVTVGKTEELNQYALPLAPGVEIPGKVFVGGDLQATGADPRRTLHHPRRRRGVPGRRAGLPRRRGERHTGFACRQAFAAQHGRQPDDDDLHPVQSRLLRRGRRRRRRNPPRPGRLVGSPGSRLPARQDNNPENPPRHAYGKGG